MILKKIKSPYLRYGLLGIMGIGMFLILFLLSIYLGAWGKIPNTQDLSDFKYQKASEIYTADSVLIGKYYLYDRQPISYDDLPQHLIDALIAIEDERFYDHSGIDYRSLGRVALKTVLMQDRSSGGGSTISQQLAKNLYPREKSGKLNLLVDKIKEMITAGRLEDIFSKEEVLQHYLNTVSFGDNTFGIESASQKFFNTNASHLSVEEAATLVGMLKATYSYNPRIFPERSLGRRNLVISAMEANEYLSQKEKDSLVVLPLELDYREYDFNAGLAPYFREEVRRQVLKWNAGQREQGNEYNIYTSGLKIYTTLNYRMQRLAEETMVVHMKKLQADFEKSHGNNAPWNTNDQLIEKTVRNSVPYKKLLAQKLDHKKIWDSLSQKKTMTLATWNGDQTTEVSTIDSIRHYMKFLNTGSLSMDPQTGAVKTWIGGVNFKYYKYDHISQSKRQVGSTFKPIVYTAALESGLNPCDHFSAQEVEYENLEGWSPSNSSEKDEEAYLNYSMEEALSNSVNTVAVKILEKTGIPKVVEQAKKMGITAELPQLPSLALGTGEISLQEMAMAYSSFVNDGRPAQPFLIQYISNDRDSILASYEPSSPMNPAFSQENGQLMIEMMKETIDTGTASRIRSKYNLKNDIAGKTGTTQNNKDAWFAAITPKLVHISWVGLDHHEIGFRNTALGQGANAALPLFALWLQELNGDTNFDHLTKVKFNKPMESVLEKLDCEPVKRDGFFKRLFKNPNKKKKKKFKENT